MTTSVDFLRLLPYYQSPMFDEDFRKKMHEGGEVAADHLQKLVNKMQVNFATEDYIPSADDVALQKLFLEGGLNIFEMLELARSYGIATISRSAESSAEDDISKGIQDRATEAAWPTGDKE